MRTRRALTLALVLAIAPALAACGEHTMHNGDANNNGTYINAGPVTYQLQISRELNPYSPEDSGYVTGVPKSEASLNPSQFWFGVFLWAKNETNRPQRTTDKFDIVDTTGYVFRPTAVTNPYAWTSQVLQPGATQPEPDTTAGNGPTGGELLLFKLYTSGIHDVYNNRPLTLQIRSPSGNKVWGTISLDL